MGHLMPCRHSLRHGMHAFVRWRAALTAFLAAADWCCCLCFCAFFLPFQEEIAGILGQHKGSNTSFIKGFKYEPSWEGYKFVDRFVCFVFFGESESESEEKGVWRHVVGGRRLLH